MNTKERLDLLMRELRIRGPELRRASGIAQSVLGRYLAGQSEITAESALRIAKTFPQVNIWWLFEGEGEMFLPKGAGQPKPDPMVHADDDDEARDYNLRVDMARIALAQEAIQALGDTEPGSEREKVLLEILRKYGNGPG